LIQLSVQNNNDSSRKNEIPWVEKYRPRSGKDIVGFNQHLATLKQFIDEFNQNKQNFHELKQKVSETTDVAAKKRLELQLNSLQTKMRTKKARLLMGPPGVGKTTVVYALANDLQLSVIEMNASDVRTEDAINQKLRETVKTTNLFSFTKQASKGKLILIDEVDGLHGQSDRGGIQALEKIIVTSQFPILMTCNFRDDKKFSSLYELASPIIELEQAKSEDVFQILKRIAKAENIEVDDNVLQLIAKRAHGDYRAAINDFQGLSQGTEGIDDEDVMNINSLRDTEADVQEMFQLIFKTATIKDAKDVLDKVQQDEIDYRSIHRWINENILDYITNIKDLRFAFEHLAHADHILGNILRTQDYSSLAYFYDIIAGGLRFSKSDTRLSTSKVNSPKFFRTRAAADDDTSLFLQTLYRLSLNDIMRELKPSLRMIVEKDPSLTEFFELRLNIDPKKVLELF
jgi:replication factor C large subunit